MDIVYFVRSLVRGDSGSTHTHTDFQRVRAFNSSSDSAIERYTHTTHTIYIRLSTWLPIQLFGTEKTTTKTSRKMF